MNKVSLNKISIELKYFKFSGFFFFFFYKLIFCFQYIDMFSNLITGNQFMLLVMVSLNLIHHHVDITMESLHLGQQRMDNADTYVTILDTRHRTKTNKTNTTTQKTKKMSTTDTPPNTTTQKTKKMNTTDPPPNTTTQKTKKMSTTDPTKYYNTEN